MAEMVRQLVKHGSIYRCYLPCTLQEADVLREWQSDLLSTPDLRLNILEAEVLISSKRYMGLNQQLICSAVPIS